MGKQKREVWDYLMDIDYGVCLGPVDRVNQCWVKDKRIFCGNYDQRTDVEVNLPELYGGDEGEGGPVGTVEIYIGSDDQVASDVLAERHDLTPATMPGYRGLCHLFFRGKGSKKNKGFRWLSMNPYLPSAKVSVTDIPWLLSTLYGRIPASVGADDDGNLISASEWEAGATQFAGELPILDYSDPSGDFTAGMDAARIELSTLGVESDQIAEAISNGWTWEVTLAQEWTSSGSLTGRVEFRVHYFDGTEDVYEIVKTGEDTGSSQTFALDRDKDIEWVECRSLISGYAFSHTATATLVLGDDVETIPGDYIGYVGSLDDWPDQPGTIYSVDVDTDDYAYFSAWLAFDAAIGGDPASVTAELKGRCLDVNGDELLHVDSPWTEGRTGDGDGHVEILFYRQIPPGTKTIEFKGIITPFIPLFTSITSIEKSQFISNQERVAGWCPTDGTGLDLLPDANPSSIVYECLVDSEFGYGEDPSMIGSSFLAAAQTLYDEKFGLSMGFFQQADVETFVQEVIDHIKALIFKDPATGLWEIALLRDDYDPDTLEVWDETNCVATNRKRRAWGETINQIVVTYTNPEDESEATVVAHDLANIQIQGGISSDSRNYYGVRNAYLAQQLADRDAREAAAPLFSCTLEVDRRSWNVTPGSVRKFSWAEDGIVEMVVRVMKVDYGSPEDRKIKIDVVEDIFAYERSRYSGPQTSAWSGLSVAPAPLSAEMALTLPIGSLIADGWTIEQIDANPESVKIGFLGDSDAQALLDIEAHSDVTAANGSVSTGTIAKFPATLSDLTTEALVAEASSAIDAALIDGLSSSAPAPGDLLMLGESEAGSEIIMLDVDNGGTWTVMRGVWDTVPQAWPVGTRLWNFTATGGAASDPYERAAGESVNYRFLPRNRQGRLPYSSAQDVAVTATDRPHAPFRPANTQLDGAGFSLLSYQGQTPPATVTATWATRNRTVEDSIAMRWTDAATAGEAGQTVTLRIMDLLGNLSSEITGLTGESHDIPIAALEAVGAGSVEFYAVRDGVESWAAAARDFVISIGWGQAWGIYWGGSA